MDKKFGGRPKGCRNKTTREMKQIIREAFELAGGAEYLARVAESHPQAFCSLLGKLLPLELSGKVETEVTLPQLLESFWRERTTSKVG